MRIEIHQEDGDVLTVIASQRTNRRKQKPPISKLISEIINRDPEVRRIKKQLKQGSTIHANQDSNQDS